jgi:hypothetical protein
MLCQSFTDSKIPLKHQGLLEGYSESSSNEIVTKKMTVKAFMMEINRKFKTEPSERRSTSVFQPAFTIEKQFTLPRDHVC